MALAVDPLAHRREAAEPARAPSSWPRPDDARRTLDVDVAFEVAGNDAAVDLAMRPRGPAAGSCSRASRGDDRTSFSAGLARRRGLTIAMVRRMGEVYPRAIRWSSGATSTSPRWSPIATR